MDFVDEEHAALAQVGQHPREVAGPFDHRPDVAAMPTPNSLAMMPASVVFPRPGGP